MIAVVAWGNLIAVANFAQGSVWRQVNLGSTEEKVWKNGEKPIRRQSFSARIAGTVFAVKKILVS